MSRLLFWLALAFLVVAAVRTKLRDASRRNQPAPRQPTRAEANAARARADAKAAAETMLCCAHCGVYFPASENVPAGGRDYCSSAHAQLAAQ
jgi:uncharacterized protein